MKAKKRDYGNKNNMNKNKSSRFSESIPQEDKQFKDQKDSMPSAMGEYGDRLQNEGRYYENKRDGIYESKGGYSHDDGRCHHCGCHRNSRYESEGRYSQDERRDQYGRNREGRYQSEGRYSQDGYHDHSNRDGRYQSEGRYSQDERRDQYGSNRDSHYQSEGRYSQDGYRDQYGSNRDGRYQSEGRYSQDGRRGQYGSNSESRNYQGEYRDQSGRSNQYESGVDNRVAYKGEDYQNTPYSTEQKNKRNTQNKPGQGFNFEQKDLDEKNTLNKEKRRTKKP